MDKGERISPLGCEICGLARGNNVCAGAGSARLDPEKRGWIGAGEAEFDLAFWIDRGSGDGHGKRLEVG